ncbi:hypothetical protein LXL04_005689 [Taraxacum kok-saghyz]
MKDSVDITSVAFLLNEMIILLFRKLWVSIPMTTHLAYKTKTTVNTFIVNSHAKGTIPEKMETFIVKIQFLQQTAFLNAMAMRIAKTSVVCGPRLQSSAEEEVVGMLKLIISLKQNQKLKKINKSGTLTCEIGGRMKEALNSMEMLNMIDALNRMEVSSRKEAEQTSAENVFPPADLEPRLPARRHYFKSMYTLKNKH